MFSYFDIISKKFMKEYYEIELAVNCGVFCMFSYPINLKPSKKLKNVNRDSEN